MGCGTAHSCSCNLETLQYKCKKDRERINELEVRLKNIEEAIRQDYFIPKRREENA